MKKALVIFVAFIGLINISLSAQNASNTAQKGYMTASPFFVGLGGSVPSGFVISGGTFGRRGWGGSLTYHFWRPNAKTLPSDFDGGYGIFGDGSDKIKDKINMTSLRVSKVFATASEDLLFGIEAGPSAVTSATAEHFISIPVSSIWGFYGRNYDYEIIKRTSFGVSLKGAIGFRFSRFLGLDLGFLSNINPVRPYYGLEILGTIGKFQPVRK